jgi:hypothetical protein
MNIEKLEGDLENLNILKSKMKANFHDCFRYYSNFEEIEDKQFHSLRKEYLEKANDLENYIYSKINHLNDLINENI